MKYALSLLIGGLALFAAARIFILDIMVFEIAIVAVAFGITWLFLLAKKREAEVLEEGVTTGEDTDRRAA
jgi:hypothetical protein